MTRIVTFAAFLLAFALPVAATAAEGQAPSAAAPVAKAEVETFGAAVPAGETLPLSELLAKPDSFAGKEVRVEGVVRRACTKKGCWMELGAGPDQPACRVTFKNYGFFVPKDAAGARAAVAGVVQVKTLSKGEVDHLEAEGATFAKAEDGTAKELRIVATGVELVR